jgi:hypothetical protein
VHSMMHAATSKVANSAQGSSCKLKFVHDLGQVSGSRSGCCMEDKHFLCSGAKLSSLKLKTQPKQLLG